MAQYVPTLPRRLGGTQRSARIECRDGRTPGSGSESLVKYERFEDLPVWQAASSLAVAMFALGEKASLRRRSLRDQIERAALSVSNNIAEGFERGATSELLAFLYIARGSAGEVLRCCV